VLLDEAVPVWLAELLPVPEADGVLAPLPVPLGVPLLDGVADGEPVGLAVLDADAVSDAVCEDVREELADAAGMSARMGAGATPMYTEPAGGWATMVARCVTVS